MSPDRRVLAVFVATLVVVYSLVGAMLVFRGQGLSLPEVVAAIVGTLAFSFFPTGLAAYRNFGLEGIVPMRRVLRWFVVFALAMDLALMVFTFLMYEMGWFGGSPAAGSESPFSSPAAVAAATIGMFIALFFVLAVYLMAGVGIVWLMTALERRLAPAALLRIRRLSEATTERSRKTDIVRWAKYTALRWLFNIPDVLDTGRLVVRSPESSKVFPRRAFAGALGWSVLFATVIAIDVSFNPFLRESFTVQQLLSIVTPASIFIPWIVLPWFIFRRLGAEIPGERRPFRLYDGLRSRVYGLLVAVGTLVLFVRLALRDIPLDTVLSSFVNYYLTFLLLGALFMFVYFNYFEDGLAADVAGAYGRLREKEESRRKDEEE
jgi:magnesium-transporting ATPase (P-type)